MNRTVIIWNSHAIDAEPLQLAPLGPQTASAFSGTCPAEDKAMTSLLRCLVKYWVTICLPLGGMWTTNHPDSSYSDWFDSKTFLQIVYTTESANYVTTQWKCQPAQAKQPGGQNHTKSKHKPETFQSKIAQTVIVAWVQKLWQIQEITTLGCTGSIHLTWKAVQD